MGKIQMNPVVEIDGDEMARVLWGLIKSELLEPFIDLKTEYYDLAMEKRDEADDLNTVEAAHAIKRLKVGVKCATITANAERVEEFGLKKMWPSPNATIRSILDGTVFRAAIMTDCIKPYVRTWVRPITVARHAYGDIYAAAEYRVPTPGLAELLFTPADGGPPVRQTVYNFECPGILQAMHNKDSSMESFVRACCEFALSAKQDLWFSTKDTISKSYDQTFKQLFQHIIDTEYKSQFEQAGIEYFYTLIDDAVARIIRSEGGVVWALKNYDGDVMSDMVSSGFGSLAMMTSVLVSPDGNFEYEAAHGTITRHYRRHQLGESTSSNPIASIFAWTGGLRKRGELDGNDELCAFAQKLEDATLQTVESGIMTKDLADISEFKAGHADTFEFFSAVRARLGDPG